MHEGHSKYICTLYFPIRCILHLTRIDARGPPQQHRRQSPHTLSLSMLLLPPLAIALPFSTHPISALHIFRIREQPCLASSRLNCSLSSDLHPAYPDLHAHASISTKRLLGDTAPPDPSNKKNLKSKHPLIKIEADLPSFPSSIYASVHLFTSN